MMSLPRNRKILLVSCLTAATMAWPGESECHTPLRTEVAHSERLAAPAGRDSDGYFVLPPRPINQYSSGEIIAVPKDEPSPVQTAALSKGEIPEGTTLFPNGCLVVVDPSQLTTGTYRFEVETADQAGEKATHSITIKLKPSGKEDADAMYSVHPPKTLDAYAAGDVLAASRDRDGVIVRTELVKGSLPAGTSVTKDGHVVVEDPEQLQSGQYAAWLATEDQQGGITLFIVTLSL